ncbi:DUF4124 domain-containing protein [Methyloversatilis sp.]|uniref:DUF4124 domain-containing protein n=1 Tax=Methyloversatilis sp. TaxID=2569862 RepID=UPI002735631C|nr:DUF4124 domain-containing protein [Methyloversatilis sp.]MDP2869251.1 DUF4124 domain-containing protein [Methyloversatilis sp.]MDP3289960.1 DUF4124 domain-containing protein [Methyloversatilis sp.]MDP3456984.1 DUF4124 domain-containing protein [Methyloversatilis sp.]MDP3579946.1 DUF4124 domain-containing protein [Methyloversatilis sp.]
MHLRLTLIALVCLPLVATAQVYQYKDANGNTVFSDSPPPGAKAIRKDIKVAPPAADAPNTDLQDKLQGFQQRREAAAAEESRAAKDKAEKEKADANCTRARNKLAALQSGQRIVRYNAQGEREFIDDATRATETSEAQQSVSEWCK